MVLQNRYCARCLCPSPNLVMAQDPVTPLTAVREFPAVFRGIFDLDLGFSMSPCPSVLHSSVNYPQHFTKKGRIINSVYQKGN